MLAEVRLKLECDKVLVMLVKFEMSRATRCTRANHGNRRDG